MPDSEPVRLYREHFKLNLNYGRRRDIDATVKDLSLWKSVLDNWGYKKGNKWIKFNPLAVGHLLSEYERRARENG